MESIPTTPDADEGPHCPSCGFRVFNRRYPKCESCGVELPESIVYSLVERHEIIEAEEARARAAQRAERPANNSLFGSLTDDPVMTTIVSATER